MWKWIILVTNKATDTFLLKKKKENVVEEGGGFEKKNFMDYSYFSGI